MQNRIIRLVLILSLALPVFTAQAGRPPNYRYGEAWWEECESDEETALLLHFGPPRQSARKVLAATVTEKKSEEALFDLDKTEDSGENRLSSDTALPKGMTLEEMKQAPVDDSNVPEGTVLDYSPHRATLTLSPGMEITPEGYYGEGLRFHGNGALKSFKTPADTQGCVEAWIRVEDYPKQASCLWSIDRDEAQLLLHPDGRLEFKLKQPHGILYEKLSEAQKAEIMAAEATLLTKEPIALKTWTHVMIYNKTHIVQGDPSAPWEAVIKVNGFDVVSYMSERGNRYPFMGSRQADLVIGNNFSGTAGFTGTMDEVRVSTRNRAIYERPVLTWRDADLSRPLHFNKPYFRRDETVFHASLDRNLELDLDTQKAGGIEIELPAQGTAGLEVPGVRGKGWVLDPVIGFPRFPLKGMNSLNGSLEFWFRPVNWDDVSGYWQHTPPKGPMNLSVARFFGRDTRDKQIKCFMNASVPRCYNLEQARWPVDPGNWLHLVVSWNDRWFKGGDLFVDGKRKARVWRAEEDLLRNLEPLYVEFGITDDITVKRGEKPLMELDEVVAYNYTLPADEVAQARARWQRPLEAIPLYTTNLDFKWSIQRLDFTLTPLLPEGVTPTSASVTLLDAKDNTVLGPFEMTAVKEGEGRITSFAALMNDGKTLPYQSYHFSFQIKDEAGKPVIDGRRDWDYKEDPWRHCTAGILENVMPPWTPVEMNETSLKTRMSTYTLAASGLPAQIQADGQDLLAAPVQFLEQGQPMTAGAVTRGELKATEASWSTVFTGSSCTVTMKCLAEYDGMIKYSLQIEPKGKVLPLQFVIPMKAERAKRFLYYPMGARGVSAGVVPETDKAILESRMDPPPAELWQEFRKAKGKDETLDWNVFYAPRREKVERYSFYGHVNLHDMNRGLWWFCDNAAGWQQSKTRSAIEVIRKGETVSLLLNLVAEAGDYESKHPIVFALLPHPARPMVPEYRLFNRVDPAVNNRASSIYDCFATWPRSPRSGGASLNMTLFPNVDPKNPEAGPSWEYAESCIPSMKSNRPTGTRTLYLSKAYFSCRAGWYDNWEWRSGEGTTCSLTPSFINYLCWEMNEWIGRGIWDAIYLDECYEHPAKNLMAGFSVQLPDGSEQPGITTFQFRELMKRWRGIFAANNIEPIMMAHHTYSWQYPGLLYCDSVLDGENKPIVSLNSRDWIDSCSKPFFETVQNARLWGISTFYMPFIAEGGFDEKERSQFPKWQWRMARQAQSMFAHYETATVYEGQGSFVYIDYWKSLLAWGGGDPAKASFHPYWDNAELITANEQGADLLVSCYRQVGGKVWLIASNRKKEPVTATVQLNLEKLGLKPTAKAISLDKTFDPPPGDDFLDAAGRRKEAEDLKKSAEYKPEGTEEGEAELEDLENELADPEELKTKAKAKLDVTLTGKTLTIPIRPRDYRVIVLE